MSKTTFEEPFDPILDDEEVDEARVEEASRKPWERDYSPEQVAEMQARKAAGEYLPGHKKHKTTYRRKHVTDKDLALMEFIARFKYATSTQLAHISGTSWKATHNRLLGLEELRMVRRVDVPGARMLWIISPTGMSFVLNGTDVGEDEVKLMRPDDVTLLELAHNMAITQTAAWLHKGMPILKAVPLDVATPYSLSSFVSEYKMRSEWNRLLSEYDLTKMHRGAVGEHLLKMATAEVESRELPLSEFLNKYPALWTLAADDGKAKGLRQFHYPDLVINRECLRTESKPQPKSIAVEVELTKKPKNELRTTLRMFARDKRIYGHVLWVVNSAARAEDLREADKETGLIEAGRMSITWLVGHDGKPFRDKPWRL